MKKTNLLIWLLSIIVSLSISTSELFAQLDGEEIDSEEVYELSPFEVFTDSNMGYMATNTLAGTRLRTDLSDLGSAISVVTKEMLEDTGSTSVNEILVYTAGTEAGGLGGNFSATRSEQGVAFDRDFRTSPQSGTRIRGLTRADLMRDYFITLIPMDSYNTERVDIQRGANSILFGLGSPSGIINNTVVQPNMLEDRNLVRLRFGRWDSIRGEVDFDKKITDSFALRILGLYDHEKFRQSPAYENDERLFVSAKWTPQLFKNGRTSIKVNFENGSIRANRPRINPPLDMISPWFDPSALNKQVWSPVQGVRPYNSSTYPIEGEADFVQNGGTWNNPYVTGSMSRWFGTVAAVFNDEDSSAQGGNGLPEMMMRTDGTTGTVGMELHSRAAGSPSHYWNVNAGRNLSGFWIEQQLTDRSVFDYFNKLIDGPNKEEWSNFDALNVNFSQTFYDDMFGVELAYDKQSSEWGDYSILGYSSYQLQIDFNEQLADGTANPNFGRPYVAGDGVDGSEVIADYETFRATAFVDLDIGDLIGEENMLTRILGQHTFTANYNFLTQDHDNRQIDVWAAGPEIVQYDPGMAGVFNNSTGKGKFAMIHYLGDAIDQLSSPSGANIPNISAVHFPNQTGTARLYDDVSAMDWVNVPFSVLNYRDNAGSLYRQAAKSKQEIESYTFIWQGRLFGGNVVPMAAYRKDESTYWLNNSNPRNDFNQMVDVVGEAYELPKEPQSVVSGDTWSYGLVLHSPEYINRHLPLDTQISLFYNESSNFQPDSTRVNVYNEPLPSPSGETKDYGITLSMLENKFVLRVNWYESSIKNATSPSVTFWHTGNNEIRTLNGMQQVSNGADIINRWFGYEHPLGQNADADGDGIWDTGAYEAGNTSALPRKPNGAEGNLTWGGDYPVGYDDGTYAGQSAQAVRRNWLGAQPDELWLANFDPKMVSGWGYERAGPYRWRTSTPPGMTSIGDVVSKGTEIELVYNPMRNWRIALNAVKQEVSASNVAKDLDQYIENMRPIWEDGINTLPSKPSDQDGFADIAFFGGYGWKLGTALRDLILIPYLKTSNLEGSTNPEVRKWRVNLVTNYRFTEGPLRKYSVGGAIRWQDKVALGYPVIEDPEIGMIYDVDNPYFGSQDTQFDLWVGYNTFIHDGKVEWNLQLNVRDIFGSDTLIPVSSQPDGRVGSFRIPNPNVWTITSTFKF